MSISVTNTNITIPFKTAIALYRQGRFDGALLANCLPQELTERECPEVLRDSEAIAYVAELLKKEN